VVDGKLFAGIIAKEKIFEEYFKGDYTSKEDYLNTMDVRGIFRNIVPRVSPYDPIERASRVLETFDIPFVAVINERDEFEGIVTHYAIFHSFGEILGVNEGERIAVTAYDIPGQLAKLTDIITKAGGDIISFTVIDPKAKLDVRLIVVRVRILNYEQLVKKIREAGFKIQ
jgi:acetoin utilization protein AcuB